MKNPKKVALIAALVTACVVSLAAVIVIIVKTVEFIMLHPIVSMLIVIIPLICVIMSLAKQIRSQFKEFIKDPAILLTQWGIIVKIPIAAILGLIVGHGFYVAGQIATDFIHKNLGLIFVGVLAIAFVVTGLYQLFHKNPQSPLPQLPYPTQEILAYNLWLIKCVLYEALKTLPITLNLYTLPEVDMIACRTAPVRTTQRGWTFTYEVPIADHANALNCDAIRRFTSGRMDTLLLSDIPCNLPQNKVFDGTIYRPILYLSDVSVSKDGTHAVFTINFYSAFIHDKAVRDLVNGGDLKDDTI